MNIIYIGADWCGPCKIFKPTVQMVSQELGLPVNYINVDHDVSLTERYNIKSIPTILVLGASGEVLYQNSGTMSREQLFSKLVTFK